jgi:hypothetical protein
MKLDTECNRSFYVAFDSNYYQYGLALIHSIQEFHPEATTYVYALNCKAAEVAKVKSIENVEILIQNSAIEGGSSAFITSHRFVALSTLLRTMADDEVVIGLDADSLLCRRCDPLFEAMVRADVMLQLRPSKPDHQKMLASTYVLKNTLASRYYLGLVLGDLLSKPCEWCDDQLFLNQRYQEGVAKGNIRAGEWQPEFTSRRRWDKACVLSPRPTTRRSERFQQEVRIRSGQI